MVILNRFGPSWGTFSCISQFVFKIDTYLRMSGIEFQTKSLGVNFADSAPKGKLPFIEHNGVKIADSSIIIDYLKDEFGDPLDSNLSDEEKAKAHIIARMIEEHLWWLMARERWWSDQNPYWHTPGFLEDVENAVYEELKAENQRKCMEHGVGAFSSDEAKVRGDKDIDALSTLIGTNTYFLGDKVASVDATAYAFLWQICNAPYESALKTRVNKHENLVSYLDRITERWFSSDPMSVEREIT